jgi:hypothetical protein
MNVELKWLRKIKNVLFCIDTDFVSYEDLLSGKYDEQLRTHMNTHSGELLSTLSPSEFKLIKSWIEIENDFREQMFN